MSGSGRYVWLRRLAVGGMGEIFLARGVDDRLVILKTLLPMKENAEVGAKLFMQEARLTALIRHPNVINVLEVFEERGEPVIALEFVDGESLGILVRAADSAGKLRPLHFANVVLQAARGLHAAHQTADSSGKPLNLTHRDISPQNILVGRGGEVKLIDFGIAKVRDATSYTQAGAVKGKLAYLAPEQLSGHPADVLTDVYSLGVVLWEACVGRRAYQAGSEVELFTKVMNEPILPPRAINADFDPALSEIITKAVERERTERFPSAGALAAALEGYVASRPPPPETLAAYVVLLLGTQLDARRQAVENTQIETALPFNKVAMPRLETTAATRVTMATPTESSFPEAAEGSLFEGLLKGVTMTGRLRDDLIRIGVDPSRLKPKYRVDVWARTIDVVRRHKYPDLPSDESSRKLGWEFAEGFGHTIGGKLVLAMLPLLNVEGLLAKMPRFFKLGRPDIVITWKKVDARSGRLLITDAAQVSPYFDVGLIQYLLDRIRQKPAWRVEWRSLTEFSIHYQW